MNKMMKATLVFAVFLVFVIGITLAVTTWHGSITWQIANEFTVWDSETEGTELFLWDEDLGKLETPYPTITRYFWFQNEADVQITVTVTESGSGYTGGFDSTSYNIPIGTRVQATLTLTITGAGSYTFDFNTA